MINKTLSLIKKYKKQISYLFFGVLTTIINYLVFLYFMHSLGEDQALTANLIAFVAATFFAYTTNRWFVFQGRHGVGFFDGLIRFTIGRITSFLGEQLGLLITLRLTSDANLIFIVKVILSFVAVLVNYVIAEFIVFKNGENREGTDDYTSL